MLNIANLYREHFTRFASGEKRTEWRFRRRIDPVLERVEIGEPILLLECGSTRALRGQIAGKIRFDYEDGHRYAFRVSTPDLIDLPMRRIQGWRRCAGPEAKILGRLVQ